MKKWLFILLLISVFSACQKEIDANILGDYQPVSAGSEWNYTSSAIGNYSVHSLGFDTTINSKKYYSFERKSGGLGGITTKFYRSKLKGVYRQFGASTPFTTTVESIYLKDTTVGVSWTDTLNVGGVNNYYQYTITARDAQRVVNGEKYFKVIEVSYQLFIASPLGNINAGSGKNYFAKNVGSIESILSIVFGGNNLSDTSRLMSFKIQ